MGRMGKLEKEIRSLLENGESFSSPFDLYDHTTSSMRRQIREFYKLIEEEEGSNYWDNNILDYHNDFYNEIVEIVQRITKTEGYGDSEGWLFNDADGYEYIRVRNVSYENEDYTCVFISFEREEG